MYTKIYILYFKDFVQHKVIKKIEILIIPPVPNLDFNCSEMVRLSFFCSGIFSCTERDTVASKNHQKTKMS